MVERDEDTDAIPEWEWDDDPHWKFRIFIEDFMVILMVRKRLLCVYPPNCPCYEFDIDCSDTEAAKRNALALARTAANKHIESLREEIARSEDAVRMIDRMLLSTPQEPEG